jgi:hypothetical protein
MDGIVANVSAAGARVAYGDNVYCCGPVEGLVT